MRSGGIFAVLMIAVAALIADTRQITADEQCRFEQCDIPLMSSGQSLRTICDCYRMTCGETVPTLECGCEEAREKPGIAVDDKGNEAGKIQISIDPDRLFLNEQRTATISVDIDLTEGRTDEDASFRIEASRGSISPDTFSINRRAGMSPPLTYTPDPDSLPGDVLVRVFGGWVVILLRQATGTVYEGKSCLYVE